MAERSVFLVGGGPGAIVQTRRHFKLVLSTLGKKRPRVAYVGAASNDNVAFRKMVSLALTGADVEPVRLASPRAKTSTARQLLADCDLVFVSGGDVHHGMEILRERDLVDDFRKLADAGKPMLGVSAGSIMLARDWVHFPDDDEDKAELFACIGAAPVHVDCHSEDDGWSELRVLVRLLHARGDAPVAYGIPSKGCMKLTLDGRPRLEALGADLPRLTVRRGAVVEDGALTVEHVAQG